MPSLTKLRRTASVLLLLALAAPAPAQIRTFPGNWGWLDPPEWGKHVLPGVESKWQRRDRQASERRAAEEATRQAIARQMRRRREFESSQARRLGFPPELAGTLDNALRSAHVANDPFSDWKLTDVRPRDMVGGAWAQAQRQQHIRASQANRWLLGYRGEEGSEPWDTDQLWGALDRRWGGQQAGNVYGLDLDQRYRPDWMDDQALAGMGLRPGGEYPESQVRDFGRQLTSYRQQLPTPQAVAEAAGADPRLDWGTFASRMEGHGRNDWVGQVNQYRRRQGDPAFEPLPEASGYRQTDQLLRRQGPLADQMPGDAWPTLGGSTGPARQTDGGAPDQDMVGAGTAGGTGLFGM